MVPTGQHEALKARVDASLLESLPPEGSEPEMLVAAMRYAATAPGKRLRPLLAVGTCIACGGEAEIAIAPGIASELVHSFSLIHDDLPCIDDDDLRRGRPTCHKVYGEAIAVLAGDALFALAFEVLANWDASHDKIARSTQLLARASGVSGLVGGEVRDILGERLPPRRELVDQIHLTKTGALIQATCQMGAIAAGAPPEQIAWAGEFGIKVGLAFQIQDDILNVEGDEEEMGKSIGSDTTAEKQTYPRAFGLEESKTIANRLIEEAISELDNLPEDTDLLRGLAVFTISRSS